MFLSHHNRTRAPFLYLSHFLEKCCDAVTVTSTGLAKRYAHSGLGAYSENGITNGRISYENPEGWYLYFENNSKEWKVSTTYNMIDAGNEKPFISGRSF